MTAAASPRPTVAVLDYGMGNLRSVARAVERGGGHPTVTTDPEAALAADAIVLPGVGAFGQCMRNVRTAGFDVAIREVVASGRPVLGVCLGMQILFEWSDEGDVGGLGLLEGRVLRLPETVKVPHMGWNRVAWVAEDEVASAVPSGSWFYFVHSYAVAAAVPSVVGVAEYGGPFAAAVAHANVVATQFHPEKSGAAGLSLYAAFVARVASRLPSGASEAAR